MKNSSIYFSIIIPLYNKKDTIGGTLLSVLNQTFQCYEILVIDDGSTDSSFDLVNNIKLLNSNIEIVRKVNGGASSARNEGIRRAKYDLIAFLDADDIWEPTYLEEQANMVLDYPEADMWGTAWNYYKNDQIISCHNPIPNNFRGIILNYFKNNFHLFWTSTTIIHKHVFYKIGFFDERIQMGEDLDMWSRIILNYTVAFNNANLAYYNQNAKNRIMNIKRPDLSFCLPYYIDKFDSYHKTHPYFIKYIHTFCAGFILPYYFGTKNERQLSFRVIKQLDYLKISMKYTLLYRTPLLFGYIVYLLLRIRSKFK